MANKIKFEDLNGWLKALVILGWIYTFCVGLYLLVPY